MTPPPLQQIFDDAYYRDPYPTYARLRAGGGVHPVALPDGSPAWLVTTEAEVRASLTNPLLSVNKDYAGPGFKGFSLPPALDANLLNVDASDHLRLRRLVSKEFTPRRVENLGIRVRQACELLVERLIDSNTSNGAVDLVADLAAPLPLTIVGDLLGVPEQDRGPFASWVSAMLEPKGPEDVAAAIAHIHGYLLGLIALRRRNPDGNLISGLISVRDEQDQLNEDELLSLAFLILMAGIDNTQHVISSGVLTLLQHPDQLKAIRADPELLAEAVEEILRYTTPNHTAIRRFPTADVEIGGTVVPAGDTVLLCLASAHRDPLRYPDPDRFDITRQDKAHLALGHGLHYCLGAPLARLQIRVALDVITTTFPALALDVSAKKLPWRRSFRSHALKQLPVTLGTCS